MRKLNKIYEYLADIIAAWDIVDSQRLELLNIQEQALDTPREVFDAWRDADKATADAARAIHALAVAVEKAAKKEREGIAVPD